MLTERIVIQKSTFGKNPFIEFLQWAKPVPWRRHQEWLHLGEGRD